jgi:hypothetical protein
MGLKVIEIIDKPPRIGLRLKSLSVGLVVLYLLASAFKLNPLFKAIITFPAVFIMPGCLLFFLTHGGQTRCLRQLIVESFIISTVFNVLLVASLSLAGLQINENVYTILMIILLLIMSVSHVIVRKPLATASTKRDYILVFVAFLSYTLAIILLSQMPRYFTPDETDYISNGRGVLNGEVHTTGANLLGSDFTALLSGRLFWTFLISSFLAATGLQPDKAYLIGPVFSTMTALAVTLLVPKNLEDKGKCRLVILLLILTNSLLIMFSGISVLNDLAIAFYATTAVIFFAKAFKKVGNKVSFEITSLLRAFPLLVIAILIKPNPVIVIGMWLWLAYVILRYKLYRLSVAYKLLAIFFMGIPLAYEVLIDIPFVMAVWFLKNEAIVNFCQQVAFVSPVDLILSTFATPPYKKDSLTLFTQGPINYLDYLYTMLTPEGIGIVISALALVLSVTMFLKPFRENIQLRTAVFITQISMIFSYFFMVGTGVELGDVSRYSLWLVPLLILIATISLYEMFSNLSTRVLFLLHIPMVILLGINYVLLTTKGGVILGWGTPRFAWTFIPLTITLFSYMILVTILTLTQSPTLRVKLYRKKEAVAKLSSINARLKAFYILTMIFVFSNLFFSCLLIFSSIGFTDHGLKYMATLVEEYSENKVVVANNYIYLRLYLSDERQFKGIGLPLPNSESEFLDLLKMVPNGTLLLITDDPLISYGFGNEYIKKFSQMDTIIPQNSSLGDLGPVYALKIHSENLPLGKLYLYRVMNSRNMNDGKGNITVNEARVLVQDNEIILNLNVSSSRPTSISTFIRAEDGRFLKAYNTSLQAGSNNVKYLFDVNSPYRYSFSLSQPQVFIIDSEGHLAYNQVVYKYNIKLVEIGLTATVAVMLGLYLFSSKRSPRDNEFMDNF